MRILIVSATCKELNVLRETFKLIRKEDEFLSEYLYKEKQIDILITGVGIASTAYRMGRLLSVRKYDYALNLGIAGSFQKNIKMGTVVHVISDIISELGAENGETFLKFDELKMSDRTLQRTIYFNENKNEIDATMISGLQRVKGITVNTVHGKENSISEIKKLFSPDVETMEGAAFLYACNHEKLKCAQLRSISNYVEERHIENWDTTLAIKNLNETSIRIIDSL